VRSVFRTGVPGSKTRITDLEASCAVRIASHPLMGEVSSSLDAFKALKEQINDQAEEVWVLALNSQLQLVAKEMIFRGTADQCLIHPRDIFRFLIINNACSFVIAHNHPSNNVLPSEQDLQFTQKLYNLALLFQIALNDHLVICRDKYFSMADHGYFKKWKKSPKYKVSKLTEGLPRYFERDPYFRLVGE